MLVSLRPDRSAGVTAAVIGVAAVSLLRAPADFRAWLFGAILAAAAFGWLRCVHHSRLILDTPTSRIASAAQGYTELFGFGMPMAGTPVLSPLNGLPVLWYRIRIEDRQNSNWVYRGEDESDASFLLEDDSGVCAIDPTGAEMMIGRVDVLVQGDRRTTQWCLLKNDPIYVLGEFATIGSIDPDRDTARQVRDLLAAWKTDHGDLLQRFDSNGDGVIDLREWEAARAEARREVLRQQRELDAAPEAHLMRRPDGRRLYLISDMDPAAVGRRYQIWGWIFLVAMLTGLAGVGWRLVG
ncbi:MAG: hypothetical protein KDH15_20910 [Rhodocyclaceae bacterium]|nr:hypothetical protein [Rhodocyclaceae bacterium]